MRRSQLIFGRLTPSRRPPHPAVGGHTAASVGTLCEEAADPCQGSAGSPGTCNGLLVQLARPDHPDLRFAPCIGVHYSRQVLMDAMLSLGATQHEHQCRHSDCKAGENEQAVNDGGSHAENDGHCGWGRRGARVGVGGDTHACQPGRGGRQRLAKCTSDRVNDGAPVAVGVAGFSSPSWSIGRGWLAGETPRPRRSGTETPGISGWGAPRPWCAQFG